MQTILAEKKKNLDLKPKNKRTKQKTDYNNIKLN